ncbi:MAG TPA: hypothetical protein VF989_11360 [Polyangiaceae bacterium]
MAFRAATARAEGATLYPTALGGADAALQERALEVDAILREAVQDLGLDLRLEAARPSRAPRSEIDLVEAARAAWVVAPSLSRSGTRLRLRLVAVAPRSRVLLVRVQDLASKELEVRSVTMLRDLVQKGRGSEREEEPRVALEEHGTRLVPTRSDGRAVLALNAAALGGYIGFSLQRATGSDDPRLLYPLTALGAGLGFGTSMIVADEWEIGTGDAWYLSAGAWWPTFSGLLLSASYDVEAGDRYIYGLVGATSGVAAATLALSFEPASEGDALMAHSGGFFGLLLGGVTELAVRGETDSTPTLGMGYGSGAGVLLFGALATQTELGASRVLMVDLGASLGALTGAALASPALLVDDEGSRNVRDSIWLGSIAAGTVAGAALAFWLTEPATTAAPKKPGAVPERMAAVPFVAPEVTPFGETTIVAGAAGRW